MAAPAALSLVQPLGALGPVGLTLGSYCSLVALWWGRGSSWPGFDSWLSLLSCVPQDWALNPRASVSSP